MGFRGSYISIIVIIALLISVDTNGQLLKRNKYKAKLERNKSISHYKGGSRGGKFRSHQYVGFAVNALNYYGDLAPVNRAGSSDISFTRPGFGFEYGLRIHPMAAIRANFNYGRLKGDDFTSDPKDGESAPRYVRNLSFRNDIKELNVGVNIYFIPDNNGPSRRNPFNAYLFVGGGVFLHEPKGRVPDQDYQTGSGDLKQAGEWVKLRPLGTEGQNMDFEGAPKKYSVIQFNIPVMLGATMRLPGPFNAAVEFGPRILFTDYIDDVSTKYVNLDLFDDPLARIMSDRSAEPTAVWNEETRKGISTFSLDFGGQNYNVGVSNTDEIALQGGVRDNVNFESIRGNPDSNDLYFVTQLKVTYIIQGGGGRRGPAKFR